MTGEELSGMSFWSYFSLALFGWLLWGRIGLLVLPLGTAILMIVDPLERTWEWYHG